MRSWRTWRCLKYVKNYPLRYIQEECKILKDRGCNCKILGQGQGFSSVTPPFNKIWTRIVFSTMIWTILTQKQEQTRPNSIDFNSFTWKWQRQKTRKDLPKSNNRTCNKYSPINKSGQMFFKDMNWTKDRILHSQYQKHETLTSLLLRLRYYVTIVVLPLYT